MSVQERMSRTLTSCFAPEHLEIINESHFHAGHAGSPGTGESHFRVVIVAASFVGKSRIERHRMVNAALASELAGGVHALAIKAHAPGEMLR